MAAVFYAINVPFSKMLLRAIEPTLMAGFLYLGAGVGIGAMSLFRGKDAKQAERLTKKDLPYVIGMIALDIAAPIFLMFGIAESTSSSASLLGNFEIVATTIIALFIFKETVSKMLWAAILCITVASAMLSLDGIDGIRFSAGSLRCLRRRSAGDLKITVPDRYPQKAPMRSSCSRDSFPEAVHW